MRGGRSGLGVKPMQLALLDRQCHLGCLQRVLALAAEFKSAHRCVVFQPTVHPSVSPVCFAAPSPTHSTLCLVSSSSAIGTASPFRQSRCFRALSGRRLRWHASLGRALTVHRPVPADVRGNSCRQVPSQHVQQGTKNVLVSFHPQSSSTVLLEHLESTFSLFSSAALLPLL